jgi:hypothetical protein
MSEEVVIAVAALEEVDQGAEEAVPNDHAPTVVPAFHLGHLDGQALREDQPNGISRPVLLKMRNISLRGGLRYISDDLC